MRPLRALLVLAAVAGAARRRGKTCVLTISCLNNFAHVLSFFEGPYDLPFDLVGVALESMSGGDSASSLRAVRLVRLLRLVKMLRVLRGSRILQRWECEIAIPYSQIAIAKSGILLIFVSHWMACIWGLTASVQEGSATEEGGRYTWLDAAVSSKIGWNGNLASGYDDWSASFNGTEAEWERFAFMRDVKGVSEHYSVIDRYFLSLYFAVRPPRLVARALPLASARALSG